jgi:hypothetical protein
LSIKKGGYVMKNILRVSGITVLAAVIVFSMTACSDGGGGGGSRGSFNPGNPSGPDIPGIPGIPGGPDYPDNPGNPGGPDNPDNPDNPGGPDYPDNPDNPDPGTQTPVASDYDIRNVFQYEGNVTAVIITPKQGKSTGAVTIYYNGSTTAPSAVGTYTVTFDVAAASGWNAASGLAGGTLTINPQNQPGNQTPVAADFNIGNLTQTAGSVTAVTITPKQGKSTGAVTIYYNGSTTLPPAAGTYTVTFNVAAASGWNAASGLAGGTLTILQQTSAAQINITYLVEDISGISIVSQNGGAIANNTVTVRYGVSITFRAGGSYTGQNWTINGVDTGVSSANFTFNTAASEIGRNYIIGLRVRKDGKYYSTQITVKVQE